MKILGFLNAYTQGASGGDVLFREIIKNFKNYQWIIATSKLGKDFLSINKLNAEFIITTNEKKFAYVIQTYLKRLVKTFLIKIDDKIDLVYSSSDSLPDTLPAFFASKKHKKPWIARTYHVVPKTRFISRLTQEMSFYLMKYFASAIITISHIMKNELKKRGVSDKKIFVIYPDFDLREIQPQKKNKNTAIFIGRLHESKGVFDIIKIWRYVIEKIPAARLKIVGTGDSKIINNLKNIIVKNGLNSSIYLTGFLTREDVLKELATSTVLIHPSHEEGFSIVILEALASGTRVVAYKLPIYNEIFEENVTTIKVGMYQKFAEEICQQFKQNQPCNYSDFLKKKNEAFLKNHALLFEKNVINKILYS